MSDAQINVIEGDQAQVVLAPGENPAIVASIPGPQGPAGAGVPTGGAANEVLYKVTSTFGDTAWGPITSAMIGDLQIVNADVSASAAIAGTKISPNFGSQNVVTTGTSTAASFIPTSSTAPTNGVYLPSANSVAISTNGQGRLFINSSGQVGIGAAPAQLLTIRGANFTGSSFNGQAIEDPNAERIRVGYKDGSLDTGLVPAQIVQVNASELAIASRDVSTSAIRFHTGTGVPERLRITSTGQLSHIGAGTSGSPAVSFSGSAPSNSLVVDSSGNVGISAAPTYRFDISNSGASAAAVRILGNDQSNVRLRLQNSGSGGRAYEIVGGSNAANNSHFTIYDATAAATRLAISDTGLVGIGTANPTQLLHVRGNTLVTGSGGWTTNEEANIYLGDIYGSVSYDFNTTNLKAKSFGIISFLTGGTTPTERLRITSTGQLSHIGAGTSGSPAVSFSGSAPSSSLVVDSSGRLGVGTSSPTNTAGFSQQLQLSGNLPCISIDNTGTGANKYSLGVNGVGALGVWDNTASAFRMYINSSGNVGIGTTSPSEKLSVVGNIRANGALVATDGTNLGVLFADGSNAYLGTGGLATPFVFKVGNGSADVERARIDSSGRLLVGTGTDSGGALLQINDNRIRIATAKTPASATDTGVTGEICWDANYVYVCTATNTWKRTALATW